jgi:hypothetical protein
VRRRCLRWRPSPINSRLRTRDEPKRSQSADLRDASRTLADRVAEF